LGGLVGGCVVGGGVVFLGDAKEENRPWAGKGSSEEDKKRNRTASEERRRETATESKRKTKKDLVRKRIWEKGHQKVNPPKQVKKTREEKTNLLVRREKKTTFRRKDERDET